MPPAPERPPISASEPDSDGLPFVPDSPPDGTPEVARRRPPSSEGLEIDVASLEASAAAAKAAAGGTHEGPPRPEALLPGRPLRTPPPGGGLLGIDMPGADGGPLSVPTPPRIDTPLMTPTPATPAQAQAAVPPADGAVSGADGAASGEGTPEGRPFGPYELMAEIGRGTSGIVYRAFHRSLRRECALKVLNADLARGRAALRFLREGQAAAKLGRHPHLVQVFDAGVHDGTPFIAMELVKGESLDRAVQRRGPLPEAELLEIGRKLALTLDHAHRCGIVHRDIKPANIAISEEGEPVILDFGIAKDLGSAAQISLDGNVIGTPAFMAPEQADPERGVIDRRTDVYALGATLYFTVTAELPFSGATVHEIIYKLLTADPDGLSLAASASRGLEAVIVRAMEKDPERRYRTALALADDLSRLQAGEPTRAAPQTPLGRFSRRMRRYGEALIVVALFLLAGVVGAAYFAYRKAEVAELRTQLSREMAVGVADELRSLLEPAQPTVEEFRLLAQRGLLPVGDPEQLAEHFAVRFRFRTRFDWLTYGDESGRFTGAERQPDGSVLLNRSWISPTGGRLREDIVLPDGTRKPKRQNDRWTYDPRERPFYKLAAKGDKAVWTPPYPYYDGDGYGVTLALPYRDEKGALLGVFTADFTLAGLSRKLAARPIGRDGHAWLIDRNETPLAGKGVVGPGSPRDPVLAAALDSTPERLIASGPSGRNAFEITYEGRGYSVAILPFTAAEGLELASVVVAPADEFEGGVVEQASRMARYTGGAAVAAAGLLLALGVRRRRRLLAMLRGGRRRERDDESFEGMQTEPGSGDRKRTDSEERRRASGGGDRPPSDGGGMAGGSS